ncbi:MAG: hypothetical protein HY731_02260 [Candidatus Tectomicrobia bacterium]|nr:hypothetical protein [Candidatus Tectomicrobia bacterium]
MPRCLGYGGARCPRPAPGAPQRRRRYSAARVAPARHASAARGKSPESGGSGPGSGAERLSRRRGRARPAPRALALRVPDLPARPGHRLGPRSPPDAAAPPRGPSTGALQRGAPPQPRPRP